MDGNEWRQLPAVEIFVSGGQSSPWFVSEVISYTIGNKDQRSNPRCERIVCGSTKDLEGEKGWMPDF